MAAIGTIEQPKIAGYINTEHHSTHQRRIERDEEELRKLEAEARGEGVETEEVITEDAAPVVEKDETLNAEEKTYKKRYGDLRVHLNTLTDKIKALEAHNEGGNTNLVPPKSEEDVLAWMHKYPDVAAIVEAIADRKATERFAGAEARLSRIDEMTAEVERKKVEAVIRKEHPDFEDIRESDAFHEWVAKQSKRTQDAIYENEDDAQAVVEVIDLYKVKTGIDAKGMKQKAKDATAAIMPKRGRVDVDVEGGGVKIRESDVNKMSMKQYEAQADTIMEAIRTGNFVYDISGGAR